ncbi:M18 family aminopeptidase [Lachnospiraceae bacterium LCP25S3_G4]
MYRQISEELLTFIEHSPSCFHAVDNIKQQLKSAGYEELLECNPWKLRSGGLYFVMRNLSSLIAFQIPKEGIGGFQIMASHSDAPTFKIKEHPEIEVDNHYIKLNVEKYGGMLCAPWFDRPLSVAGRVLVKQEDAIVTKLVDVKKDLLIIPSLAIHMNREANEGYKYNAQVDMQPLYGTVRTKKEWNTLIAESAKIEQGKILGMDLFLYNRMPGCIWGAQEEFISSPKLDDLQCAFATLRGFLQSVNSKSIPVYCIFDNEEVGSGTKQGAASTFLEDTLQRISHSLGRSTDEYRMALMSSFMVSADNAHAVHPNYVLESDPTNRPYLNEGVVVKHSANQKYTTDAVSAAIFTQICERAQVPFQTFVNRSDKPGGSTLGNIANTKVSVNTVDIGLPQLAMHSPYETAGIKDTQYLIEVAKEFYSTIIEIKDNYTFEITK